MANERTIAENSLKNSQNCAKKFQYIDKNRYDARDFYAPGTSGVVIPANNLNKHGETIWSLVTWCRQYSAFWG
jgi:hypothetical protein